MDELDKGTVFGTKFTSQRACGGPVDLQRPRSMRFVRQHLAGCVCEIQDEDNSVCDGTDWETGGHVRQQTHRTA